MMASFEKSGMNLKPEEASAIMGIFASCLYLAALPGGWLADNYLGQKKSNFTRCFNYSIWTFVYSLFLF